MNNLPTNLPKAPGLVTKTLKAAGLAIKNLNPTHVINATNAVIEFYQARQNYKIVCEQEKTKRDQIKAMKEVHLAYIKEQASIMREYLKESFAERRENFDYFFNLLDQSIANGNDAGIQAALTGIIEITRRSPLADALKAAQDIHNDNVKVIDI